eukprot:365817-Chlamydomonas_euryale.AAC.13
MLRGATLVRIAQARSRASANASIVNVTATVANPTATVNEPPELARQTKVQQYDQARERSVLKVSLCGKTTTNSCLVSQKPCSHGMAAQWPPALPAVNMIARAQCCTARAATAHA